MWKLAQRSLLQGKTFRSLPHRCSFEQACYLATKSNATATSSLDNKNEKSRLYTMSSGNRKRQREYSSKPMISQEDATRLLYSAKGFLEQSPTLGNRWSRERLEIANKILHTWTQQSIPRDLQSSWITTADELISILLDQCPMIESSDQESSSKNLIPSATVFCNIITMYSKSNLPNSAERADYWLQEMIQASEMYPDRVTHPRASLFANVLSAWEKSKLPEAEARSEMLWKQLKSIKGLTPTSSAYYIYISLLSKSDSPEAAEMADKLLREMVRSARRNPKLLPTAPIFANVISSWKRNQDAQRAQMVLSLLVKEYVRRSKLPQEWLRFSINDVPFNATIEAWAKSSFEPNVIESRINTILKTMKELNVESTVVTAWSALPMYSPRKGIDTKTIRNVPTKILQLLDSSLANDGGGKNPKLRRQVLTKALEICRAHSESDTDDSGKAAEVAEEILLDRYFKMPRTERRVETTITGFEHCIRTWSNDNNHGIEYKKKRIQELLQKMEKEVDHVYQHTHKQNPSAGKLYASLAKAWSMNCHSSDALERASDNIDRLLASSKVQSPFWLQDIIEVAKQFHPEEIVANFSRDTYSKLLANEAQFFLMMKDLDVPKTIDRDPSVTMDEFLNGILDTLLSSGGVDSGRRAEIILLKQQELYDEGKCLPPTFETFKKVLGCWSNSQENGAAERMENMVLLANSLYDAGDTMLRPDFDGYMAVITEWSKSHSPDAPDKIQNHLKTLYERRLEGDESFAIDSRVYAALIRAYTNSGRGDAQTMAYSIFESAPDDVKDTSLYNLLIEAQGGDSSRAEELLQLMQLAYFAGDDKVKPNTETFNALIQTWLRSGSSMAAWRADGIFKRMEELSKTGRLDVKPNSRTFELVISTLAQDWGAELAKVDVYLALLKEHYQAGDCVPTSTSYNEAIRAWASKNDDPRAILRAQALLDEMHELVREGVDTVRPTRDTYEVYLDGICQSSVDDRKHLVDDVLFKMREHEFDLDDDIRSSIQRCLLPVSSRSNSWIVDVDDLIKPKTEWLQTNNFS